MWVLNFEYLKSRSSVCFQQSSTLPLSPSQVFQTKGTNVWEVKTVCCLKKQHFIKIKCLSKSPMNIEHPVAINYCNDLFDTTWAHSQQNIWSKQPQRSQLTSVTYLVSSPAGDRRCRQGRPRPGSGRSSSTWGGRWWTWWGRRPDCTCRYHWLASRRSWWEGWEGGRVSWLRAAGEEPGCCQSRRVGPSSPGADCPPRH